MKIRIFKKKKKKEKKASAFRIISMIKNIRNEVEKIYNSRI